MLELKKKTALELHTYDKVMNEEESKNVLIKGDTYNKIIVLKRRGFELKNFQFNVVNLFKIYPL